MFFFIIFAPANSRYAGLLPKAGAVAGGSTTY